MASNVPSIAAGWGPCTAYDGGSGHGEFYYGTTNYGATQPDGGGYYWRIFCQFNDPVTVPNVLGIDEATVRNWLSGGGAVTLGTVSSRYDCLSPGDVEMQSPTGGAIVRRGTAVNLTISRCSSGDGGGGSGGGGGGGGGGGPAHPL